VTRVLIDYVAKGQTASDIAMSLADIGVTNIAVDESFRIIRGDIDSALDTLPKIDAVKGVVCAIVPSKARQ
jgi:hypothetical protein